MLNCPDCGRAVSAEAEKCPACGFRLGRYLKRRQPVDLAYCRRCRAFVPFGLRRCPRCKRDPGVPLFFERPLVRRLAWLAALLMVVALIASC